MECVRETLPPIVSTMVFYEMLPPGTINIFVYINQNLTDAAIGRALMLCSEAKAAAVSHLLLGSCYSEEIATGSGTDGTVIAACMDGKTTLTDASGHSKLGELIGRTVSTAVTQALLKQTAASGARQFQVLIRTARYGITPGIMWDFYIKEHQSFFQTPGMSVFEKGLCTGRCFFSPGTVTAIWFYVCLSTSI